MDSSATLLELEGCLGPKLVQQFYVPSPIHGPDRTDLVLARGGVIVSIVDKGDHRSIETRWVLPVSWVSKAVRDCTKPPG